MLIAHKGWNTGKSDATWNHQFGSRLIGIWWKQPIKMPVGEVAEGYKIFFWPFQSWEEYGVLEF